MKIIIVGAGIAGLSTYLFLRKHLTDIPNLEIKIYEGYDISRYIEGLSSQSRTKHINAAEQSEAEVAARSNILEEGFNVEAIGSAIGIAKNGLDVLSRLFTCADDSGDGFSSVLQDMIKQGHPVTKWEMSCARGWMLADMSLVPKAWRKKPQAESKGCAKTSTASTSSSSDGTPKRGKNEWWQESPITTIMIGRQAFWSILLRHVVKLAGSDIIRHTRISAISIPDDSHSLPRIDFTDGSSEEADLIIGADGLRSTVRKCIFASPPTANQSPTQPALVENSWFAKILTSFNTLLNSSPPAPKNYVTPHYEGLAGVGGFVPSSVLKSAGHKPGTMGIVFGPNGFFGHGYITSEPPKDTMSNQGARSDAISSPGPIAVYWSTFSSAKTHPYSLPSATKRKPYEFDRDAARSAVLVRHRNWKNPTIQAILKYIGEHPENQPEGFYPTYTTPELPRWSSCGRIVLVGDAAHALQPSSGQGACQALEDAETLALTLRHSLQDITTGTDSCTELLQAALRNYEAVRMPRLHAIYERTQKMSGMKADMGFLMEMTMYAVIKIITLFHDDYNEKLVGYDLPKDVERVTRKVS